MKKIMIFAALAAALSLASCKKDGLDVTNNGESSDSYEYPVFTGEIDPGFKTTIDLETCKVSWEMDDKITVTDEEGNSALYEISSIDETGNAVFKYKSGDKIGKGPYTATYGTAPAAEQEYSEAPADLYMTAYSPSRKFTFAVQCGLMEITLTKTGVDVRSIAVTGTPTGGKETTYTLTCVDPQSIAEGKTFYVAVPEGTYNKYVVTNKDYRVCTLTAKSDIVVAANHIKSFNISSLKFTFPGVLPGKFTVNKDGKKVYFSNGNLFAGSDYVLHFEENQRYVPYNNASHKSLFTWSSTLDVALGDNRSGEYLFCDEGHKISVENSGNIFYAPSKDEWVYLFKTREVKGGTGKGYSFSVNITYGGQAGVVLYPDDYKGSVLTGTVDVLPKGVVFLPATGQRSGNTLSNENYGRYLSSTPVDKAISKIYRVSFQVGDDAKDVYPENEIPNGFLSNGFALRLVVTAED